MCLRNEAEVGQAIKESGIKREDIFVVTKLASWSGGHGYDQCIQAFKESFKKWVYVAVGTGYRSSIGKHVQSLLVKTEL